MISKIHYKHTLYIYFYLQGILELGLLVLYCLHFFLLNIYTKQFLTSLFLVYIAYYYHSTYIIWQLRTCCAGAKENRTFLEEKSQICNCPRNKCVILHNCAPISHLLSNISTMTFTKWVYNQRPTAILGSFQGL